MDKAVFRLGEYINHYIEDVVENDPAYIVEHYPLNPDLGITETQYNRALRLVNEWDGGNDPEEDWFWLEQVADYGSTSYD